MRHFLVACTVLAGCANNPGMPKYRTSQPPPLRPAGPPRAANSVALKMKRLPWWSVADDEYFVLRFDVDGDDQRPIRGRSMGAVRSRDIEIDDEIFEAVRCAWSDSDRCARRSILSAGELSHDVITEARAELRAHGADAGAGVVGDVRCFAERKRPGHEARPKLWCEGVAFATNGPPTNAPPTNAPPTNAPPTNALLTNAPTPTFGLRPTSELPTDNPPPAGTPPSATSVVERDPAAPQDHEPAFPEARFTLVADAGVGMQGGKPIVSSTLGIRYRPIEVGFYIVDLQRESVAPRDDGLVGVGLTVLGRKQLRAHSGADAILGGSAIAAFQNGSTNPDIDGLYQGFVGLAYQSRLNIWHGQPWVQLRAGGTTGTAVRNRVLPLLELHLGLATPERR